METGVAFLMYHELGVPGRQPCQSGPGYTRYIVSASAFESQVLYLKTLGYKGFAVGDALASEEKRKVCMTFDDGCETDLELAAPILSKCGFAATFYITVGFLGENGYMNRSQLRELSGRGFEIGSHSLTHPFLPELDDAAQEREIVESKERLEEIVGRSVEHFSCPGGRFDSRVVKTAKRAGYRTLTTSRPRLNSCADDPYSLGRISVLCDASNEQLAQICRGSGLWKMRVQQNFRQSVKRVFGDRFYDRMRDTILLRHNP